MDLLSHVVPVLEKLERLRAIDRQCQAFGAGSHQYVLRPRALAADLDAAEHRLGVHLPPSLRDYYSEVADGGAGPNYGLLSAADVKGLRPAIPYPGAAALRRLDPDAGKWRPDYFEVPREAITGLLAVIEEGCGHRTCLVATATPGGPGVGSVVYASNDGCVVDTDLTLPELFHQWLDGEPAMFEFVRAAMAAGKTFAQVESEFDAKFGARNAGDRIASIANVPKPESLFGPGGNSRFHGASQFPWYDRVLREWQARAPSDR